MFIRIVLVLLVLSCRVGLAQAEWKEAAGSDNFTVYIDPTSYRIDKKNGQVKLWVLYDFKTTQKDYMMPFLSIRVLNQYDCKEGRSRTLAQSLFDGNMANGDMVSNNSNERTWEPIAPGTIGKSLWKLACLNVNR